MKYTLLLLTVVIVTFCWGCKKDKVVKATNISNQQAATMIATALAQNADGFISIKNDMVVYAKALTNAGKGCGVIDSFAVARQEAASSTINYNYALGYSYIVNCDNSSVQDNLSGNVVYHGSFEAVDLSAVNSVTSAINISPLSAGALNYTLSGNLHSEGTFKTIDATQLSGDNTISFDVQNLVVVKSSRSIIGGTILVNVAGTVKNKNAFSYTGNLTFKNATTATLSLEATNYTINLVTAELTAL